MISGNLAMTGKCESPQAVLSKLTATSVNVTVLTLARTIRNQNRTGASGLFCLEPRTRRHKPPIQETA